MVATTDISTRGHICLIGAADQTAPWAAPLLADQRYVVSCGANAHAISAHLDAPPDLFLIDAHTQPSEATVALTTLQARLKTAETTALLLLPGAPADALADLIADTAADYLVWPPDGAELLARVAIQLRRRARRQHAHREHVQLAQDHAARQRALEAQRALTGRFQRIFEQLPIGAVIISATNQIEHANEALCRFLGYRAEELIGRQPGFMVLPEDHAATTALGYQLAAGQIDHFVRDRQRYVRKDGSPALGKLTTRALHDDAGRTQSFLAFVEDIGSRVQIEDELGRYTRYQQALTNASLCLLAVAPDVTARSQALVRALQQLADGAYASRSYLFRNVNDPQLGLGMTCAAEAWSAGLRSFHEMGGAQIFPFLPYAALPTAHRERLLAPLPAGGLVEELYAENPVLLAAVLGDDIRSTQTVPVMVDGAHWGFIGFDEHTHPRVWDHTDLMLLTSAAAMVGQTLHRWQIEDDLRATSQFLRSTGRLAHVGGWAVDMATRQPMLSDELVDLLGLERETMLDLEGLVSFYAPEAQPAIRAAAAAAIRDGVGWELEVPMITRGGRRFWASSQGQAERRDGSTVRLYGAVQDVTPRKEAELHLERQLRIEAALSRCSQELLAPVQSEDTFRTVVSAALQHLRSAIEVEQAYLMRHVPDPDEPYLTMAAFASVPVAIDPYAFPLAQRFPLSLLPPHQLACLDEGRVFVGFPRDDELRTDAQRAWMAAEHARSRLSIPVRGDDRLWGVLGFSGFTPREWGDEEVAVLVTAAGMLGHVIRRWIVEQELRQSEEQFRTAVETMLDGFAILDAVRDEYGAIVDFRYRYINEVGCRLNRRTCDEQLGRTLLELLPAYQDTELFADYVRLVETGAPVMRESLLFEEQYGSGERLARVFDVRASSLGDGFVVVWRDVTDRHLAHASLAQANDDLLRRVNELRTLNQIAQTLASTHDLKASLEDVCGAIVTRTGATSARIACFTQGSPTPTTGADDQSGVDLLTGLTVLAPAELGALADPLLTQRRSIALVPHTPGFPLSDAALCRLQGAEATHLLLVPLSSAAGNLGLLALGRGPGKTPFSADDQSLVETMASQIATSISNARLGEQAQQAARLAERHRVARDLHDSATQALYSLSLLAGGWAMQAEQGRLEGVTAKFTQLGGIALQVLKELRLLIYELRHPEIAAAGLVPALEDRLAAVEQRASVRTSLAVEGDLAGLSSEHAEQIYAILQEGLNNTLRHAQARSVAVSINAAGGQIVCTVRDDGIGFEPDQPSSGLGLRSMRERAAAIGAQISLASAPGQGTLVEIRLTIPELRGKTHGRAEDPRDDRR